LERSETLKILWLNPVGAGTYDSLFERIINEVKRKDVDFEVRHLASGPHHLEYKSYEPLVLVETLKQLRKAEQEGFDACVIGCFDDPGLQEARELVNIPIIGPGETCFHLASMLGARYSIITGRRERIVKRVEDHMRMYGVDSRFCSFRFFDMQVPDMRKNSSTLFNRILSESRKAIKNDGAEVIVVGCTCTSGFMKELIAKLKVPVLDISVVSFKYAEMLADLHRKVGLSHSKVYGYKTPPEREILI
jgi:allantoin racemase